jgi:hypothetical protein
LRKFEGADAKIGRDHSGLAGEKVLKPSVGIKCIDCDVELTIFNLTVYD